MAKRKKRKSGPKVFVLDTNVLLHDPGALFRFKNHHVVVPIYVLEEIDQFKKELSELGRNARAVSRYLDDLRGNGTLVEGVDLPSGGRILVALTDKKLPPAFGTGDSADNRILASALATREKNVDRQTVFVTKDINLRIRADALGLTVEDYDPEAVDIDELYPGWCDQDVGPGGVQKFYDDGSIAMPESGNPRTPVDDSLDDGPESTTYPNEYMLLRDETNPSQTALGRLDSDGKRIVPLVNLRSGVWGIRPRNKEQSFALDALLHDDVKLVTLAGKAGTGKTLLALAAGLHKTADERRYRRMLVARPIFPLGRDLGYLPGDIEEKLNPWMQPIYDNIELLMGLGDDERGDSNRGGDHRSYHELLDMGLIQVEPLTYIRGRSIPAQFMIVDEAQNLTPHEVKTIITRAGEGTKIILTGDPYQIDSPYIDSSNNGITYVVNRLKTVGLTAHITLSKGERSNLAELAANLL